MESESLEPHGLPSPKAHLCAYGYTILKNALKGGATEGPAFLFLKHIPAFDIGHRFQRHFHIIIKAAARLALFEQSGEQFKPLKFF